jgi:hypothetical protein
MKRPSHDSRRREQWRQEIPNLQRLVEEVSPAAFAAAAERRVENIPAAWKALVDGMQKEVHERAETAEWNAAMSVESRRGYQWYAMIMRVGDMIEHLLRMVRADLGMKEGEEALATMILVKKSLLHLQVELQDGGTEDGREDSEENRVRVFKALMALNSRFDDIHLRRLRAMQVAENAARRTRIPSEDEVKASTEVHRDTREFDADRHRKWMEQTGPAMDAVLTRSWLAAVDEKFKQLDPLVVLEEFHDAEAAPRGGKADGGEGRTGAVRALARLALMCGALEAEQEPDEEFDEAVDRVRATLLVSRSRIRKFLRSVPGQLPPDDDDE